MKKSKVIIAHKARESLRGYILNTNSFSVFCLFLFPFLFLKILNRSKGYAWKFWVGKEKNKLVKIPEKLSALSIFNTLKGKYQKKLRSV